MGIGLFYNTLDWTNKNIIYHLKKKGFKVEAIDINNYILNIYSKNYFKHKLYLNRVYPSSNLSSYNNLRFMLEVTKHIENLGIKIINPFLTTFLDYSKTEGNNTLEKSGIPNPQTILISNKKTANKLGEKLSFPKVIKTDAGGKALNVFLASSLRQYKKIVSKLSKSNHLIHIEEYVKPPGFITRVFILNHKFMVSYKRIISKNQWLGSASQGSKVIMYPDVPKKVINLGITISKKIKSNILGLDIIEAKNKNYVIDINPTPVFNQKYPKMFGFDPTKSIADYIESVYRK